MTIELEEMWNAMKNSSYKRTIERIRDDVDDSKTVSEAIEKALNIIIESSHSVAGTFWYYDRFYDGLIYPKTTIGGSKLDGISIKLGEGFAGKTIKDGKSITVFDCKNDDRFASDVDEKTGFVTSSMICVPLKVQNTCFGCIQIINKTDGLLFDEKDLAFVEDLANILTYVMFKKGMLNDFITSEEKINSFIDNNKLDKRKIDIFTTLIKQSDEFIALSFSKQQEVIKELKNIENNLSIKE